MGGSGHCRACGGNGVISSCMCMTDVCPSCGGSATDLNGKCGKCEGDKSCVACKGSGTEYIDPSIIMVLMESNAEAQEVKPLQNDSVDHNPVQFRPANQINRPAADTNPFGKSKDTSNTNPFDGKDK